MEKNNPAFEAEISGLPEGVTLTQAGLDNLDIQFDTFAFDLFSAPGIYPIGVSQGSISQTVADNYDFVYQNGSITIEKLPITVMSDSIEIVYGENIPVVSFNYTFEGNIGNPDYARVND